MMFFRLYYRVLWVNSKPFVMLSVARVGPQGAELQYVRSAELYNTEQHILMWNLLMSWYVANSDVMRKYQVILDWIQCTVHSIFTVVIYIKPKYGNVYKTHSLYLRMAGVWLSPGLFSVCFTEFHLSVVFVDSMCCWPSSQWKNGVSQDLGHWGKASSQLAIYRPGSNALCWVCVYVVYSRMAAILTNKLQYACGAASMGAWFVKTMWPKDHLLCSLV